MKPAGLAMGRGVIRTDDAASARDSERRIRKIVAAAGDDPAAPLLLEEYVPGVEVAVEALLRGGRLETLAVFDKPDPLDGPFFEETIYVTPSRLPEDAHAAVERSCGGGGRASGCARARCTPRCGSTGRGRGRSSWPPARSAGCAARRSGSGSACALEELILRHALGPAARGPAATRGGGGRAS